MRASALLALLALFGVLAFAEDRRDLYEWVRHPPDWKLSGRADPSARHMFAIGLPHPNRQAMEDLFWAVSTPGSPKYRKFLAFDEIHRMSDPGVAVTGPVLNWLRSVGSDVEIKVLGEVIHCTTTIANIERLFNTEMAVFRHVRTHKPILRHLGKTSVPAAIRDLIQIVEGIHEFPRIPLKNKYHTPTPASELAPTTGFAFTSNQAPSTYFDLYNLPSTGVQVQHGSSNGIFAQFAADGAPLASDLTSFDGAFSLPAQKFNYNGQSDPTVGGEASLDVQMITTLAQNGNTTFFMQQAWMYIFSTYLLSLGDGCPLVISVSYGWAEAQQCSDILHDIQVCQQHGWGNLQYIQNTDQQFIKLGLAGRTFVVCSQDEGAPGETNDGCSLDLKLALYPEYPASSPYVTAVGATAIVGSGPDIGLSSAKKTRSAPVPVRALTNPCNGQFNCTRGAQTEMPCYLQNADFTTGGGFSQLEKQPAYQASTVQAYLKSGIAIPPPSKFNSSNRAYPDVGALGQNTLIVMNGAWLVTGGTSASTPITAGIFTLLNDYLLGAGKAPLGFVNPLLYQMAANQTNTFNQITQGNNKCTEEACCTYGYLANPKGGWNPATGLGSPNYGNMLAYIKAQL